MKGKESRKEFFPPMPPKKADVARVSLGNRLLNALNAEFDLGNEKPKTYDKVFTSSPTTSTLSSPAYFPQSPNLKYISVTDTDFLKMIQQCHMPQHRFIKLASQF
jgi:hypothetical protein